MLHVERGTRALGLICRLNAGWFMYLSAIAAALWLGALLGAP